MLLNKGKNLIVCGALIDNPNHLFGKSALRHDVLNQYAFTPLSSVMRINAAFCMRIFFQIIDVSESGVFHPLTQQIEDALYGMNGPAIVGETGRNSLVSRGNE